MAEKFDSSEFAFLYFAISFLLVFLIPLTYYILKNPIKTFLFQSYRRDDRYKRIHRHTSGMKKIQLDQKERKFQWLNSFYFFKLFLWILLLLVFYNAWQQLPDPELMRGFDPFEVLEINRGASLAEIKKAYRRKALQLHPDKANETDDKQFIRVTKAYECLQDPKKQANCLKYGNPDGFGGFSISIALPSFISDKQNQALYLVLLLGGFTITIIGVLYSVFSHMGKYNKYNILTSNVEVYKGHFLKKKLINFDSVLNLLSELQEFEEINRQIVPESLGKNIKDKIKNSEYKTYSKALLVAYMNDVDLSEKDKQYLNQILKIAPNALQSAVEYGIQCINKIRTNPHVKAPISVNDFTLQTMNCLKAQSLITQGLNNHEDVNKQLPQDVNGQEENFLPKIEFTYKIDIFDPDLKLEEMTSTDLYLLRIKIQYKTPHMLVFSNKYPYIKEHNWHLILIFNDQIVQYRRLSDDVKPFESPILNCELKIVPFVFSNNPAQTNYKFKLLLMSDSYLGYNQEHEIIFKTKPADLNVDNEMKEDLSNDEDDQNEEDESGEIEIQESKRKKQKQD